MTISQQSIASWADSDSDRRSLDLNRSSRLCQWVHKISLYSLDCSLSLRLCLYPSLSSVIYCFVYYLWVGHNYCYAYLSGFTALFLLPGETDNNETSIYIYSRNVLSVELSYRDGQIFYLDLSWRLSGWGPQWLSYLWYLSDGGIRRKSLTWTHILHLGLFKRWAILVCVQQRQCKVKVCQGLFTFDVYDDKKGVYCGIFFSLFRVSIQAAGVHDSARRGRVRWDHAAGRLFRLTSVWGLGGHPPSDAAAVLCAHLYWHRNQVSRYGETEHGNVESILCKGDKI